MSSQRQIKPQNTVLDDCYYTKRKMLYSSSRSLNFSLLLAVRMEESGDESSESWHSEENTCTTSP